MDKARLIHQLEKAWDEFKGSFGGLPDSDLMKPATIGDWSIKEIISHVTTWENEALKYLPLILAGEKTPRYSIAHGGIHAFNAQMAEQKRSLPLSEVMAQMDDTHRRLAAFIRKAPEEQFVRETRFRHRLRLDTYTHYRQHAEAIRMWRESQSDRSSQDLPWKSTAG